MSTDSTQPMSPPAPQAGEPTADQPAADAPAAAVPTVQSPTIQAPPPPPPPPSSAKPMAKATPKLKPEPEPAKPSPEPEPAARVPAPPTVIQPAQPQPNHAAPTVIQPTQAPRPPIHPVHAEPTQIQPTQIQPTRAPSAPIGQPASPWTEPQPWVDTPQDDVPPPPPGGYPLDRRPRRQPPAYGPPRARRQRRRPVRRSVMTLFGLIVLVLLLTIADRVSLAVAENDLATGLQQQGFPIKPSVTIEGVPFLTQLAAKDFNKVDVSASNVPVQLPSGGTLTISTIHATARGVHFSSYSGNASGRIDSVSATAFISFSSLSSAAGIAPGSGVTFAPASSNTVRITASILGLASDSEDVRISVTGPQTVSVKLLPGSSVLGSVLSSFGSFSFNLPPGLPSGFKITALSAGSEGLTLNGSDANATFGSK